MISASTGGLGGPVELSVTTIECAGVERGDGAELVKIPRLALENTGKRGFLKKVVRRGGVPPLH